MRNGRRLGIALGVVVVLAVGLGGSLYVFAGDEAPKATGTGTTKAQRGEVTTTVSASGTVASLASRKLAFTVGATVTELNVKAGDTVVQGTVLAKVDATAAQAAVDTAQSNVDSAQDAVDKAEAPPASSAPAAGTGSCVQAAAALPLDARPSGSPSAHPSPSASASASPSVAPTPPTSAPTQSRTGGSGSCNSGTSGGNARGGAGTVTRDNLLSAQQQLNNAKLSLSQARTRLAGTAIAAPVSGRVLSVAGVLGSMASAGSTFIVLAGSGDAAVTAQFTEAEVAKLQVGQQARITLPDRKGTVLTGSLQEVDLAGTTSNRLVRYGAQVVFDQVPEGLLYGQSATVAVITQAAQDVVYVPSTAVQEQPDGRGVVTVKQGGQLVRREVDLGLRGDATTEIRSGLDAGEEVLSSGR